MGEFAAQFPRPYRYAKNHMWGLPSDEPNTPNTWRFGLTAYAVRLLQDVYFLEWEHDPGMVLQARQQLGSIESKKAESDLYSPTAGKLHAINELVLGEPSLINADPYGEGWLFEIVGDDSLLIDASAYASHLVSAWNVAQKTIKGQANS
ncbi:MAG: glycine cleavage system protein H [Planctomycetota bacterium]